MKKIITIMIVLISLFAYVTANDCDSVVSAWRNAEWNFEAIKNWTAYEKILPAKAINQAMLNLKSFCCVEGLIEAESCKQDGEIDLKWIYPSSVYLYDHILDISMRRLDAKIENDNWEDLMYWLDADETGKEWRDFITKTF